MTELDKRLTPIAAFIGNDDEGFILVDTTGFGVVNETVEGATPLQALEAVRAEKAGEGYTETELARQRAEAQESGMVACGGFAMPCASRTPFRVFADFVGADPRFREEQPVKVSQGDLFSGSDGGFRAVDDQPIVLKPWKGEGASLTLPAGSTLSGTLTYPDGNPKTAAGAKKPDLSVVPPVALLHLATAMMNGAEKYGPFNWRDQPISYRPYLAAAMRHLASCLDGEDFSADTVEAGLPVHHLGHVMACCAIVLDAVHCKTITDNRPKVPGQTGAAIELYNQEKKLLPTPQSA